MSPINDLQIVINEGLGNDSLNVLGPFENLGIGISASALPSAFKSLKDISQKVFQNWKKSYLEEHGREKLCGRVYF